MKLIMSRMTAPLRLLAIGAHFALLAVPAAADEPAGQVEETPPPLLCATLSAPAEPDQLKNIEGWTIRYAGPDGLAFRETILRLDDIRSRSTRFVEGANPTAHQVRVDQRRICVDLGGEAPECLLAISCADAGIDYVLVDNDTTIRAALNSPFNDRANNPADYADLAPDHDWVPFAQGTTSVMIEASGPVSSHTETRRAVNNDCLIQGHPATLGAFAYAWSGTCFQGKPTGAGTLVRFGEDGSLERYRLTANSDYFGAILLGGVYIYNFPSQSTDVKIICLDANGRLPESSDSVSKIDITADIHSLMQIEDRDSRGVITKTLKSAAHKICKNGRDVDVSFALRGVVAPGTRREQVTFNARYDISQAGRGICQTSCPLISCGVSDFRGAGFTFGVEPDWPGGLPVAGFS